MTNSLAPKLSGLLILLVTILVTSYGCVQPESEKSGRRATDGSEEPALPSSQSLIIQPKPEFILGVSPAEATVISQHLYTAWYSTDPKLDLPTFHDGFDSTVCVKVDVGPPLWQPGDDFTEVSNVLEHVTMQIDGKEFTEHDSAVAILSTSITGFREHPEATAHAPQPLPPAVETVELIEVEPVPAPEEGAKATIDAIPVITIPWSPDRGTISWVDKEWLGPLTICWKAELGVGVHQATFQFRQTSGDIQTYSWYFEITED